MTNDWPEEAPVELQNIAAALSKAQASFEAIRRDKTVSVRMKSGGTYSFSYAPLESILRAVMPSLNREGLSMTQAVVTFDNGEFLETTLHDSHGSGISNRVKVLVGEPGPQAYGSALTYARRYGITLLLCVCADDDDDGNAAEGNEATQTGKALDPRGTGHKHIPPSKAEGLALKYRDAIKVGIDQAVYDIHAGMVDDEDLYTAVWDRLSAPERREIKEIVARVRLENQQPMQANGKAAPTPR